MDKRLTLLDLLLEKNFTNNLFVKKKTRGIGRNSVGNKKIEVTIIGKFKVNEFAGKQRPQIEIVEFDSKVSTGRSRTRNF